MRTLRRADEVGAEMRPLRQPQDKGAAVVVVAIKVAAVPAADEVPGVM